MKKNLKNLLLIVLMGLSVVFMGACGDKKSSNKDVITNFVEASKGIKNLKMEREFVAVDEATKNETMKVILENVIIKEPFAMKLDMEMMGIKSSMYVKDGMGYNKNELTNKWEKEKVSSEQIDTLLSSYLPFGDDFYDALKSNMDKVNIEKKDKNYVFIVTDTEFLKDIITKEYASLFWDGTKLNNFTFECVVDEKTFLPETFNFTINTLKDSDKSVLNVISKYSQINEIKDIELPDEVKNAEEAEW